MREHRPLRLSERLEVESALEAAFAPLRCSQAELSPLRVRAAVRWGRGATARPVRWAAAVARLSELSVAVGMTAMLFVGAFGSARFDARPPVAASMDEAQDPTVYPVPHVTAALDDERYIRWLRLDRYVPLQDWLDPAVIKPGAGARTGARLDLPGPSAADARGPF